MTIRTLIAVLVASIGLGQAHAQDITGDWQQADFVSVDKVTPECVTLTTMTRTIWVDRAPDGHLTGAYSTCEEVLWVQKGSPSCKFSVASMSPDIFQRARTWSFLLAPQDATGWRLGSGSAICQGDACGQPGIDEPFASRLSLQGDRLVDTGVGVRGGAMKFQRAAQWLQRADDAAAAWPALMKPLDRGDCNGFFQASLSADSPLQKAHDDYCEVIAQRLQSEHQPIVSLSVGVKTPIDRRWVPDGAVEVKDVLLAGFAIFQDGSTLPRQAILRREQGQWKVVDLFGR